MPGLTSLAEPAAPRAGEIADAELVRRVRRGDESAFEQLYHRYHRRITAYIHGMVHDHARAEDVAQDVFVSALRRMRETERPIAFKPWIYEIAKNACIDQFRRSRRAEEVSYDADEGLGAADYGRLVSSDAMPEDELESKTNLDHLRGAFGGLSDTHHEILVMRELEGLSYREIGDRLGMSRPSVESTLFRARRRLTEEYEELVSGARCQRVQAIIAEAAAGDLGARDQRRLARHVSHCQPCRRQARLAGLDVPVGADQPVRARIAAMLPLPVFLRRRWLGHNDVDATSAVSSHANSFAQWSTQLGATVDPGWLKAAATAATIAVAGVGASAATHSVTVPQPAGSLGQVVSGLESSGGSAPTPRTTARRVAAPAATHRTSVRRASPPAAASHAAGQAAKTSAPAAAAPTTASATAPAAPSVDQATSVADDTKTKVVAGANVPAGAGPASPSPASAGAPPVDTSVPSAAAPSVPAAAPDVSSAAKDPAGTVTNAVTGAIGGN